MLNFLKALAFFGLWATIALTTHYFVTHKQFNNCNISSKNKEEKKASASISKFYILDKKDTIYSSNNGITIFKNSEKIEIPQKISNKLSQIINSNYNKQISLTSLFSSEENLSIAKARNTQAVNNLISNGISKNRIKTSTQLYNFNFNNNIYNNGILIKISTINKAEIDTIEAAITTKRLHVNIIDGKLQITNKLVSYTKLLQQYFKLHSSKTIYITGHTDNKGYFQNNLVKGQIKADKLKEYFIENGINSNQIKTYSKGEAKPIANKYTLEGKKLNNRIEININ